MEMTNQNFHVPRLAQLLRVELSKHHRTTLLVASVTFLFLLGLSSILVYNNNYENFHNIWFGIVIIGGGVFFTSNIFNELNTKEGRMGYLSLPASTLEKFILKLLIVTVGYVVLATCLYNVFSVVAGIMHQFLFQHSMPPFNPFNKLPLLFIKIYLVIHAMFLLGAVTFNRYSYFKTSFFSTGIFFLSLILSVIVFRIIFADQFDGFSVTKDNLHFFPSKHCQNVMEFKVWPALQYFFWLGLAPILWVIAYFKLKEREA